MPLIWWIHTYAPNAQQTDEQRQLSLAFERVPQLIQIKARGYLRVATLVSPTIYVPDDHHPQGLEYDLVTRFAEQLGLPVRFIQAKDIDDAYALVAHNQADFAAAGLVVNPDREAEFRYGPSYLSVRRQLIYRTGSNRPKGLQDLGDATLAVEAGSSSQNWLSQQTKTQGLLNPSPSADDLGQATEDLPDSHYAIRVQVEPSGLRTLEALEQGKVDYAIVLSHQALLGQKMSDKIRVATDLGPPVSFAWAFSRLADRSLYDEALVFFNKLRQSGELRTLIDRHYAQFEQLDQKLAQNFLSDVENRISPYLSAFKAAGKKYQIDWRLLAAMAYQESKWQPNAESHKGAYGMMQITPPTAQSIGLNNPGNPTENIMAAAKYLNQLRDQVNDNAPEPDRTYLAMAAYNIGIGHLNDAITLTTQQGGNPDRWRDIRARLLQLSEPAVYRKLKAGFAQGEQTVQYVENIRALHDLLIWVELHRDQTESARAQETQQISN
ncbi:membrane-bound lytic murein transglycosylase MltF [Halothiobacillus sp. DCM-1]|uniref:membrane-bound lytic murein transglycosylase MltF n=1 Tax=Halothiobacillus sp. DCM-1 TaxID=3112558 RepID=UPI0032539992